MASNGDNHNEKLSGFDIELVNSDLRRDGDECAICTCFVKQPLMIATCGHIFCHNCLMHWIKTIEDSNDSLRCPIDNREINKEDLVPDKARERVVLDFRVYCKNKNLGCSSTPELRDYEAHINDCEYNLVLCPFDCGQGIMKRSIEEHKKQDCVKRIANCSICEEEVIIEKMDSHIDVCPLLRVPCIHCENENIIRKELDDHINRNCPKYPTYCEFALFGCNIKIPRQQLVKHHEESCQLHADLLNQAIRQQLETVGTAKEELPPSTTSLELPLVLRETQDVGIVEGVQSFNKMKDFFAELGNQSLREDINMLKDEQLKLNEYVSAMKNDIEALTDKLKVADKQLDKRFEMLKRFTKWDILVETCENDRCYIRPLEWHVNLMPGMNGKRAVIGCFSKVGGFFFRLLVKNGIGGGFTFICRLQRHLNNDSLDWPYPGGEILELIDASTFEVLGSDSTPSIEGSIKPTGIFGEPLFTIYFKPQYLPFKVIAILKKKEYSLR